MLNRYQLAALPFATLDRAGLLPRTRKPFSYVVERANWATRWDGIYVQRELEKRAPGISRMVDMPAYLARSAVHFFSHHQWRIWGGALARSNRYAVTFYHGKREDGDEEAREIDAFLASAPQIDIVVTAASIVEKRLSDWGIPENKLVRIPIPIDTEVFRPATAGEKQQARQRYRVPEGHIVVGSFQKDGVGWGDGTEPKRIKGPDVLLEVLDAVHRRRPVFVLLSGPARGFVKEGLARLGIPFAHDYVEDYEQLPRLYAALDVYLNPSREEGGPKGVLESMACGIPLVSTRVGMAPDLISHRQNGFLAEPGDAKALAEAILELMDDAALRSKILPASRDAVQICNLDAVGKAHYHKVVLPLLAALEADR